MNTFILPISDPAATDADTVGPKAANLAALMQAGLPTPGGFALNAAAYNHQIRHLGIEELLRQFNDADRPTSRRLSVQIRLELHQKPIAPEILEPLLAAWRAQPWLRVRREQAPASPAPWTTALSVRPKPELAAGRAADCSAG